jgi:hypothetical protein
MRKIWISFAKVRELKAEFFKQCRERLKDVENEILESIRD